MGAENALHHPSYQPVRDLIFSWRPAKPAVQQFGTCAVADSKRYFFFCLGDAAHTVSSLAGQGRMVGALHMLMG
jgi:2-polyprenyl-6-methoxyphenol hydroxylase-like FAD-dependent oxidoreductase